MPAATASVIGIPSKTTWSSTAVHKVAIGDLWCTCSFTGDDSAPHEGRKFIKFFESLDPQSPAEVYRSLQNVVQGFRPETTVSLSIVLTGETKSLVMVFGSGLVGLVRDGLVRWLADGTKEHVVLEGDFRSGDMLVLGTERARELGLTDSLLEAGDPDQIVAQLFARVQQHVHSGEIALYLLRLGEKTVTQAESAPEVEEAMLAEPEVISIPGKAQHLISPQRLEQGILASQEEQSTVLSQKKKFVLPLQFFEQFRGAKVHWLRMALVAGALVALIVAFVGYRAYSVGKERREVLVPLELLITQLDAYGSSERAQQRAAAQSLLERLKATRIVYNTNRRQLEDHIAHVEAIYNEVSGEKAVVNLPVFYDFRLVQANFLAGKAGREKEQSVYLDTNGPGLMKLNIATKKNERLPTDGLNTPNDVTVVNGTIYTLDGKTVKKLPLGAAKHEDFATVDNIVEASQIDAFGETLYLLDRGAQQIWKIGTAEGATASGWVRSAKGVDFSKITSLSINGSIWLGSEDGEIFKLTRGERESFSLSGVAEPFSSTLLLATTAEGEKLVAVEPKKERFVVLSKTGEYLLQVKSEQIGAVTDVFLNDEETTVYLVAGSVVYQVEI